MQGDLTSHKTPSRPYKWPAAVPYSRPLHSSQVSANAISGLLDPLVLVKLSQLKPLLVLHNTECNFKQMITAGRPVVQSQMLFCFVYIHKSFKFFKADVLSYTDILLGQLTLKNNHPVHQFKNCVSGNV